MFISISTSPSYSWYKYRGKKVVFENHNKNFDLTLTPSEIFGVDGTTVVHEGELDIKFKFTAKELEALLKQSAALTYDTNLYPKFPLPCTKQDVAKLYKHYNAKLFNNECPADVEFIVSPAKRFYGQAGWDNGRYTLRYGKAAMTDVPFFCTMVIHEMIHLLTYKRLFVDNDMSYLHAGHGPKFLEIMRPLNAMGYKIDVVAYDHDFVVTDAQEPVYLAVYVYPTYPRPIVAWDRKPFDPQKIMESISVRFGLEPTKWYYGLSTNSLIIKEYKLVDGDLPKLPTLECVRPSCQPLEKLVIEKSGETQIKADVSPRVLKKVNVCKQVIDGTLAEYVAIVIRELDGKVEPGASMIAIKREADSIGITDVDFDYITDSWNHITDTLLEKSRVFKYAKRRMLQEQLDGLEAVAVLVTYYREFFQGRVSAKRYALLCAKHFDIITLPSKVIVEAITKQLK